MTLKKNVKYHLVNMDGSRTLGYILNDIHISYSGAREGHIEGENYLCNGNLSGKIDGNYLVDPKRGAKCKLEEDCQKYLITYKSNRSDDFISFEVESEYDLTKSSSSQKVIELAMQNEPTVKSGPKINSISSLSVKRLSTETI
ncbi:hypothetical protein HZU77_016540 [Neisseriaceae bacterium TC5R-5]|nr:hypothetical protein [Neisseriaceae bacterium TC5R-5]